MSLKIHICNDICSQTAEICKDCNQKLLLTQFVISNGYKSGHRKKCKSCARSYAISNRRMNQVKNSNHDCEISKCKTTLKYCNYHKTDHFRIDFFKNRNCKDSHHWKCKYADRIYAMKKLYGITLTQFAFELKKFKYCCHLCKKPLNGDFVIDHCHEQNIYRGILHRKCNWLLGHADDNAELLQLASNYIKETKNGNLASHC